MRRLSLLLLGATLVFAGAGCGRFVTGLVVGVSLAHAFHYQEIVVHDQPVIVVSGPANEGDLPPPPAEPSYSGDPFNPDAARASLDAADDKIAACRDEGVPSGYGHARVTFGPNGRTARIVIDSPSYLSMDAVRCIGDKLAAAEVPPFRGAPMTVGETWYLK